MEDAEAPSFVACADDVPIHRAGGFFPMPVVVAVSHDAAGQVNVAPYSLCFPEPARGPRALLLIALRDANTWRNVVATGKVALCFVADEPSMLARCVALATPDAPADKMRRCGFALVEAAGSQVVAEAEQVYICRLEHADHRADLGERRMHLTVEQVLLRPRWARSLTRGFGAPRLAVEYGFRGRGAGWVSRPRVEFGGPALRPRFVVDVRLEPDEVLAALQRALHHPGSGVRGFTRARHAQMQIPAAERSFWSPELEIEVDPLDGGGARLTGKIGPHSRVWTMFLAAHGAIAIVTLFATMGGVGQWMVDRTPWALLALPLALVLHAFVAGAAFVGQGLGASHTFRLKAFVEDALTY